jgi:hypothetical protein
MSNNEKRDVRAIVRTYKDNDGKDKNVYQTIGTAWVSPHESTITVQIETLPISKDWNGKLYINKPYEKKEEPNKYDNDNKMVEELGKARQDVVLEDIDDKPINLSEIPF